MRVGHHSPMVGEEGLGNVAAEHGGSRGVASSSGWHGLRLPCTYGYYASLLLSQLVVSRPLNHPLQEGDILGKPKHGRFG